MCRLYLLYPNQITGDTSRSYRFYSVVEPPPRKPQIFRDLVYPFTLQPVPPALVGVGQNAPVIQVPSDIHMQACDTVVQHPIPPLTLCRRITPKHD